MTNKIIIGDNLKELCSERMSKYINGIKMIYIDPPYNTQTIKSYNDMNESEVWGNSLKKVIQELFLYLRDDGVIFISIDDSEYANLKIICDNVFSRENFVGTFITKQSQRSNSKHINTVHEYILCYAKNKNKLGNFSVKRVDIPEQKEMIDSIISDVKKEFLEKGQQQAEKYLGTLIKKYCEKFNITWLKNYNCVDTLGNVYFASDLSVPSSPRVVNIPSINLYLAPLKTRGWVSDKRFVELYDKGLLVFRDNRPYYKKCLSESRDNVPSILNFYSRQGTNDLNKLGLKGLFDTPKPVALIKFLIRISNVETSDIVLDCYGGSGTTMQSVIEVNKEDGKEINCILIQQKEKINSKSSIYSNCNKYNIAPYVSEILKLRIKKVIEKHNIDTNLIEIIENE